MPAVWKRRAGSGAEVGTAEVPSPGPGHVLIRVKLAAICGTDVHIYAWDPWSASRVKVPVIMGHEFMGELVELGSGVEGFEVGERVSGEGHIVCGQCFFCRTGLAHVCRETRIIGVDTNGCFARFLVLPAANVWRLPPSLPDEWAAVLDPFGNACHAASAFPLSGARVLVMGCGPIGLFSVGIAKALGASAVVAVDIVDAKLKRAEKLGATAVFNARSCDVVAEVRSLTDGLGADVALEMSGSPQGIEQCLEATREEGGVALMGIPADVVPVELARLVIFKGLSLKGVIGRRMFGTWIESTRLLASGKLDISPVITHRLAFGDIHRAMGMIREGEAIKVLLDPWR